VKLHAKAALENATIDSAVSGIKAVAVATASVEEAQRKSMVADAGCSASTLRGRNRHPKAITHSMYRHALRFG